MTLILIAGLLAMLLGIIHSVLGEKLIFSQWRKSPPDIRQRHQNIIWASWHIVSFLGVGIGGLLIALSRQPEIITALKPALIGLVIGFILSGLLVLYATKGKHPGWIVLLIIAILTFLSLKS